MVHRSVFLTPERENSEFTNNGSIPNVRPSSGITGTTCLPMFDFIRLRNNRTKTIVVDTLLFSGVPESNSENTEDSGIF